ncbi:MAG: glycosyltransferase [Candidatus Melainabacteria bacterium]|nr:glycosyltransferase [Candidatus Melainabacteria bacterium]
MVVTLLQSPIETSAPNADRNHVDRSGSSVRDFKYSIVVPVFNGADKIEELFRRIAETFNSKNCRYEIVIVNDGSTDNTWATITKAAANNPNITAIDLTRNFGQHPAVLCGLANSTGDYVLTIDADLQNPPEELFKLIEPAVEKKLELIFAKFTKKQHAFYRRLGSHVVSYLNEVIFAKPKDLNISNVRIMSKDVVARMCQYPTAFPYINGLALRCSNPAKRENVLVEHHKRTGSDSTYTPVRIARLVCTILFNYKELPRLISNIGYGTAWFSFVLAVAFIAKHYFLSSLLPEFTPIVVVMAFCNGILALLIGVLGAFSARMSETLSLSSSYAIGSIVKGE